MKTKNRYLILAAGMVIQLCAGIIYMWSVFRAPVAAHLGWDIGSAGLTSSIMLALFVAGIIIGGKAQDMLGPRKVTIAGSILISAGMMLSAAVSPDAPWVIYFTYGVIGGFGVGAVYTSTVSVVQKWFPDRRGFASGMIVCAFGFSLVLFSPLAKWALEEIGVPRTFLLFGIAFLIICVLCALLIQNPPKDDPAFAQITKASAKKQYKTSEMLKTKQYYLLAFGMFFTLPAYFILNPILMDLGAERGLSNLAVVGVMLTGIGSASGRLIISWSSDKIGRKPAMIAIAGITLIAAITTIFAQGVLFLVCLFLIAFCFGGSASVYAAFTADNFGTEHIGMNFGCVMLGFGASALLFPVISNALKDGTDYTMPFIVATVTCVIAIILVLLMKKPSEE